MMIVPSTTTDGTIGPDIPEGVEWQSATRNPDGTYTLVLRPEYAQRLQAEDTASLKAAARLDVTDRLRADALDDATIAAVAGIYDPWEPGLAVTVGQVLQWDGTLVEVIQAHTTQADWTPDLVPALFRIFRTDDGSGPIEWIAGIAVTAGEQVTYQGVTYNVLQGHTTQAGWEPPNVPALFEPA